MKKILSLLIALLISTNAYAGETEINRLKSSGMSAGLANEVDDIYVATGEAQILTSPTISGNLTFSTAAAKIIPGATSLTFRNNADSVDNLSITDAGIISVRQDIKYNDSSFFVYSASSDAADNQAMHLASGGSNSATRGAYISAFGNENASTGALYLVSGSVSGGDIVIQANSATSDILLQTVGLTRWTVDEAGALTQNATNGGSLIMQKAAASAYHPLFIGVGADNADANAFGNLFVSDLQTTLNTSFISNGNNAGGQNVAFLKTRSADVSGNTIVNNADIVGDISFWGADGTDYGNLATIQVTVDGAPGNNDLPGAINFLVSPDGNQAPASALKLSQDKSALFTGTVRSSATADIGWSFVDATDNQACNTGCASACVFGIANATGTAVTALLGCADATADSCICAGSS